MRSGRCRVSRLPRRRRRAPSLTHARPARTAKGGRTTPKERTCNWRGRSFGRSLERMLGASLTPGVGGRQIAVLCPRAKSVCPREKYPSSDGGKRARRSMFRPCATSVVVIGSPWRDIAPNYLGDPNDLENSKDRRGAGGHGNQHVRLRRAQIDCIETICPALVAICCYEPWQTSLLLHQAPLFRYRSFKPVPI